VRYQRAELSSGARLRTFSGTAKAGAEILLSFRVPGRIERLSARVGQIVSAGDLLAQLERDDFEIAAQQAEARLAQAEANARNAAANYERIQGLYVNQNASRNDLDAARANADTATAQVEAAEKSLQSVQRQLGYTRLLAPVDWAIASVPVDVNENVSQGQMVALLTGRARPEVEVAMPGVLIQRINEGDPVTVTFNAIRGQLFGAVITEVGVAAVGTATTFPVTVRLIEDDTSVRSGMAADVTFRFESESGERTIFVPAVSVGEDREGRFVFVVEPAGDPGVGVVRRRAVAVGAELMPDGSMAVADGLAEGEQVVTAGVRRLTDGQRVKLTD
jgi:RND family efflux transporter MFP subunit